MDDDWSEADLDPGLDEDLDDYLEAWREAEQLAAQDLRERLPGVDREPPPQPELEQAAARLRAGLDDDGWPFDGVARAMGWAGAPPLPDDELLVSSLAALVAPPSDPEWPVEEQSVVATLDPQDWLTAVVVLVEAGPGAEVDPAALAAVILADEDEDDGDDLDDLDDLADLADLADLDDLDDLADLAEGNAHVLELAFTVLLPRWYALGVVDGDDRLTALGAWALPRALLSVWAPSEGPRPDLPVVVEATATAGLVSQLRTWRDDPAAWTSQDSEVAAELTRRGADAAAYETKDGDDWEPFLRRLYDDTQGTRRAAGPAFLLARRAEWRGDTAAYVAWLDTALGEDPDRREVLYDASEVAAVRGDAAAARDLLLRAGVRADDVELAVYRRFAQPPTRSAVPRNAPCPCGSGRKSKLCCGARVGHPLRERASWLWLKLAGFVQRPPQRADLLGWAARLYDVPAAEVGEDRRVVLAAMLDVVVTDLAVFDGGLLDRFLEQRGSLLPSDEAALAESWRGSRRSAFEVVATRAGFGARLRDLVTEEVVDVDDRISVAALERGEVVLTRLLAAGEGPVLGAVRPLPRLQQDALVSALREPSLDSLLAWLRGLEEPLP